MNAPWGLAIDGNDDVWVASGLGRGVAMFAGANPDGHPPGVKPGDLIHFFQGGTIQIPTIGPIDPAGNVWVANANNWDSVEAATAAKPFAPTSTQGGGSGFTIIYGVAAPVKTPLLGTVRKPQIGRQSMKAWITASAGLLTLSMLATGAAAQTATPGEQPPVRVQPPDVDSDSDGNSATALAKKLQNPTGGLYSFPFQNNTNFNTGPHQGTQDILNVQPVIPIRINCGRFCG